jgi:hypothetical protein
MSFLIMQNCEQWTNSTEPLNLSVMHHSQKPEYSSEFKQLLVLLLDSSASKNRRQAIRAGLPKAERERERESIT